MRVTPPPTQNTCTSIHLPPVQITSISQPLAQNFTPPPVQNASPILPPHDEDLECKGYVLIIQHLFISS